MRKISVIILFLISIHSVLNASTILPGKIKTPPTAKEVMIPLIGTDKMISLEDFLNLTPTSYKNITGKKMSYGQKLDLGISKHYLKKMIRKDGTVDVEKMKKKRLLRRLGMALGRFCVRSFSEPFRSNSCAFL